MEIVELTAARMAVILGKVFRTVESDDTDSYYKVCSQIEEEYGEKGLVYILECGRAVAKEIGKFMERDITEVYIKARLDQIIREVEAELDNVDA